MFKHDEAVRDLTMARVSTKENKNIYQLTREELKLSREAAGELLESIQPDRIEKIENERSLPHPEEILVMADKYKQPGLCNYYCANQCPIGQQYVPEVKIKALSQIVLEMLASLNAMNKQKERLIEITADGQISGDESGSPSRWRRCNYGLSRCWPPASLMRSGTRRPDKRCGKAGPDPAIPL